MTVRTIKMTLALSASLAMFWGVALAEPLPVGTTTLDFADGSTASGFFVYDPTTNKLTSWDFQLLGSVNGVFGAHTYNSADDPATADPTGSFFSNFNGYQVFAFKEFFGTVRDEFDIVVACGGVANCITQATAGITFPVASGPTPCPGAGQTGFCIESGEQLNVPEDSDERFLQPGFFNVTDPVGGLAFNGDTTATGRLFGSSGGGGTGTSVPEPGSFVLLGTGLLALAGIAKRKMSAGH